MARPGGRGGQRGRWQPGSRASAATVGLVALLVVDIVLVIFALRGRAHPADQASASVSSETQPTSDSSGSAEPSPTSSSDSPTATAPAPPAVPLVVRLDAVNDKVAWRASVGTCAGGAGKVERTQDGGKTWQGVTAPGPYVLRLKAQSPTNAFAVVGTPAGCAASYESTTNGGTAWAPSASTLRSTWYLDPVDATKLHAPGGETSAPCGASPVVDLEVATNSAAAVLCPDGALRTTGDAGAKWASSGSASGAVALAKSGADYLAAVTGAPGCSGVAVVAVGPAGAVGRGCADGAGGPAGSTDLAASGGSVWLVSGGTTYTSPDGGRTWHRS